MLEPHSAFVDIDTIRLHYLEWDNELLQPSLEQGSDELPIVLLHGLGATAHTWRLVAERLCVRHRVVAFDLRGHGLSEHCENGYDMAAMAEDCVHGMAALGMGQVVLVGHGLGARIALVLAARHPALISHLALVDCPHVEPRHWPGMTRERFIRETAPKEHYASRGAFIAAMHREMGTFWSPEVEAIVHTYIHDLPDGRVEERLSAEHQRHIREALWEDRALSYYSKIVCPVLLVPAAAQPQPGEELPERLENADEFAAAKGHMAEQVARTIQHCSVLWMPTTTHDIQLQRPQALADAIEGFIS
jgi:pimeloyl-ACP methyl ester carboxylesterase